jgi:hypothetical protein
LTPRASRATIPLGALPPCQLAKKGSKMQSNTEKLRILINEYIYPLPNITNSQLHEVIDCMLEAPKGGSMVKAVKLLRDLYLQDKFWDVSLGDGFCTLVQQSNNNFNPVSRSSLSLKKAVEIVRFISNNRDFL